MPGCWQLRPSLSCGMAPARWCSPKKRAGAPRRIRLFERRWLQPTRKLEDLRMQKPWRATVCGWRRQIALVDWLAFCRHRSVCLIADNRIVTLPDWERNGRIAQAGLEGTVRERGER